MAPEIRSILRYMDDYIETGDYDNAIERGISAIKVYDHEREYDSSISILEKLIEIENLRRNTLKIAKYTYHVKVRAMLARDHTKLDQLKNRDNPLPTIPMDELLPDLDSSDSEHIIVETIERQTIFGDFEPLTEAPFLTFENHEEAVKLVEDYFEEGRYIVNLLDSETQLHQAFDVDNGTPEEINIVDREHIFRYK